MLGGRTGRQNMKLFPNSEAWLSKVSHPYHPSQGSADTSARPLPHVQAFPASTALEDGANNQATAPFPDYGLSSWQIPTSRFLGCSPNTPCSPFRSIRMGCRRDRCVGKPVASGRDDGGASGPATVSALRPRTPPP